MQKRVAAIHDISCFGRCSLTVALPVLSAAGIETCIIPTAVLSTHTGGFTGYTFRDLTNDILPIANHWSKLGIQFDALYTGYLGSFEQLEIVTQVCSMLSNQDTLRMIDPVMADNGKLYATFSPEFPKGMRALCSQATMITPNMSEAYLLLGEAYQEGPYTKEEITRIVHELSKIGPEKIVLTGVYFTPEEIGAASYDVKEDVVSYHMHAKIPGSYHGTGDVFSSTLLAAFVNGKTLQEATDNAVTFTTSCIARSYADAPDVRYGVNFEYGLKDLFALCNK